MAIGYACMTIGVPNTGMSRCILKNASNENLRSITASNLSALEAMIDYNTNNHIKLFRISSDIIPFASHPINQIPWWEEEKECFLRIGQKIKSAAMRVSMHPGQYTVLNSFDPKIVQKAIEELIYHNRLLNALEMDDKSKLVLHIGGVYGDKSKAMNTFILNYNLLPEGVKRRLIIENDDKNYTIQEVLQISNEIGTPVVFDNLHHELNVAKSAFTEYEWIKKCELTWSDLDGRQKIHYSQQKVSGALGSHSDTILISPFMEFYQGLPNQDIDIMLEVKDKNLSALKCIHVREQITTNDILEMEWERYSLFVLSRSIKLYYEMKKLLKVKEINIIKEFYHIVEQAYALNEEKVAEINAAQHVWGYLSKDSSGAERKRFEKLMTEYENGNAAIKSVKNHLQKCAQTRELKQLLTSLYFYL